jgi:hypothetical protein
MYGRVTDQKLKSYGKIVEYWPNKLNRYMRHVRYQGSEKLYTMSKDSVEDVHNQNVVDEWIKVDQELLNAKK